jgi:hypothetical protein
MRFRDWYQAKDQNEAWGLKQAMFTIQNAAPTKSENNGDPSKQGRVTWLRPLDSEGKSLIDNILCPIATMPAMLEGKDWTRYEGLLHTDHAVREEFFLDREIAPTGSKPYLMDFTYLYDDTQTDFEKFSRGKRFTDDEVFAEIGRPEAWTHRSSTIGAGRSEEEAANVAEQLRACGHWESPPWHVVGHDEYE